MRITNSSQSHGSQFSTRLIRRSIYSVVETESLNLQKHQLKYVLCHRQKFPIPC